MTVFTPVRPRRRSSSGRRTRREWRRHGTSNRRAQLERLALGLAAKRVGRPVSRNKTWPRNPSVNTSQTRNRKSVRLTSQTGKAAGRARTARPAELRKSQPRNPSPPRSRVDSRTMIVCSSGEGMEAGILLDRRMAVAAPKPTRKVRTTWPNSREFGQRRRVESQARADAEGSNPPLRHDLLPVVDDPAGDDGGLDPAGQGLAGATGSCSTC